MQQIRRIETMLYLIEKNGKYLNELFPYAFKAKREEDAYKYNVKQIAYDIAKQCGATVKPAKTTNKEGNS